MTGNVVLSGVQWKWFGVFMDQPRYEEMRELTLPTLDRDGNGGRTSSKEVAAHNW